MRFASEESLQQNGTYTWWTHTVAQTRKSHPKTCLWCFENVGGHTHTDSGKKHVSHIPKHVSADILKKLKQPERQQIVIDDMQCRNPCKIPKVELMSIASLHFSQFQSIPPNQIYSLFYKLFRKK